MEFLIHLLLLLGGYDYKYKDIILHTVTNVSGLFETCIFLPRFYGCWDDVIVGKTLSSLNLKIPRDLRACRV